MSLGSGWTWHTRNQLWWREDHHGYVWSSSEPQISHVYPDTPMLCSCSPRRPPTRAQHSQTVRRFGFPAFTPADRDALEATDWSLVCGTYKKPGVAEVVYQSLPIPARLPASQPAIRDGVDIDSWMNEDAVQ